MPFQLAERRNKFTNIFCICQLTTTQTYFLLILWAISGIMHFLSKNCWVWHAHVDKYHTMQVWYQRCGVYVYRETDTTGRYDCRERGYGWLLIVGGKGYMLESQAVKSCAWHESPAHLIAEALAQLLQKHGLLTWYHIIRQDDHRKNYAPNMTMYK